MVAGVLYIANYQWHGKTVKDHVTSAYKSGLISEGVKDISTWIESLFNVGKKIKDGDALTAKDKEKLEAVIQGSLKDNIQKLKEEAAKTEPAKTGTTKGE